MQLFHSAPIIAQGLTGLAEVGHPCASSRASPTSEINSNNCIQIDRRTVLAMIKKQQGYTAALHPDAEFI